MRYSENKSRSYQDQIDLKAWFYNGNASAMFVCWVFVGLVCKTRYSDCCELVNVIVLSINLIGLSVIFMLQPRHADQYFTLALNHSVYCAAIILNLLLHF